MEEKKKGRRRRRQARQEAKSVKCEGEEEDWVKTPWED